jgi:cytochrome P450
MDGKDAPDFESANLITDMSLIETYLDYYKHFHSKCPIALEPNYGMLLVTGHPENVEIYQKDHRFSTCQALGGPTHPLPFEVKGDDIREQLKEHRHKLPWSTHFITMDDPEHAERRQIMTRFLTHKRLKKNTEYMMALADRLIDKFIDRGQCEFVAEFGQESGTLVISDMLAVPEEDRRELVATIGLPPGMVEDPEYKKAANPLEWLDQRFTAYIEARRKAPCGDILSELAEARFPDGSIPPVDELARIASFTFVAGQDTSVKMMAWAVKYLCDYPELQDRLRAEPNKIADFVEEILRLEAPTKQSTRTALQTTTIGGVEIQAGTMLLLAHCAANRDPRVFENPDTFDIDRSNVREHLAFARGPHACPGAPLARMEGRVCVERFLARMKNIRISEAKHGPPHARRYERQATYILNGLEQLHLEFEKR